jgi:hypothetical protein
MSRRRSKRTSYVVGGTCATGQVIAEILGQSDTASVYTTRDNHLRWEYFANGGKKPPDVAKAIATFDSLMARVRLIPSAPEKKRGLYEVLGKALFSALDSGGQNGQSHHFRAVERMIAKYEIVDGNDASAGRPPRKGKRSSPRLFVSHRHNDEIIAAALVSTIESAFVLSSLDVRCTSVRPYRLAVGERTPDRLRAEITNAEAVIGIIGPDTKESSYVLFELGAAWSHRVLICPLLVRGAKNDHLPDPIKDLHTLSLTSQSECHELLDNLAAATSLKRKQGTGGSIEDRIRTLARVAAKALKAD